MLGQIDRAQCGVNDSCLVSTEIIDEGQKLIGPLPSVRDRWAQQNLFAIAPRLSDNRETAWNG
jgi:hypothetical protein